MAIGDVANGGAAKGFANVLSDHTAILSNATMTEGDTIVAAIGLRNKTHQSSIDGWIDVTDYIDCPPDPDQPYRMVVYMHVIEAGETTTITLTETGSSERRIAYVQLEGTLGLDAADPWDDVIDGTDYGGPPDSNLPIGTLTPSSSAIALVGFVVARLNVSDPFTVTVDAPDTELGSAAGSQRVPMLISYQRIDPASGSYTPEWNRSSSGGMRGYISAVLAFNISGEDPDPPDPPTPPGVTNGVYDDDGDLIDELVNERREVIRIERLGYGSGSFEIRRDAPDAALVGTGQDGRMVVVTVPRIWDQPIFRWMIEHITTVIAAEDEEGGELITVAGRGALAYVGRAVQAPESYVVPAGEDPDGVIGGPASTGNKAGQMLRRAIDEYQHEDRPQQPIPLVTTDFTDDDDSDGNAWTDTPMTPDLSVGTIGENALVGIEELWGTGEIDILMQPNMLLQAFNHYGRDLTSTTFAAGKVRFVKGVNIASKLTRVRGTQLPVTHTWVKGTGAVYVNPPAELPDAASRPVVEGYVATEGTNETALEELGLAAMREALRRGESVAFKVVVPIGDPNELTGQYLPGPEGSFGHYWVGDEVTIHTGTGVDDFDNEDARIEAITIAFDDADNLEVEIQVKATTILGRDIRVGNRAGFGNFATGSGTGGTTPAPAPTTGALDQHLADSSDAHDASAVSFDDTGMTQITSSDVQGAIEDLDAAIDGLSPGGGSGPWTEVVSSADEDATDTGTQDHTEFQFAVTAGKHYDVEFDLLTSGNNTTGDFRWLFALTAGTGDGRGQYLGFSTTNTSDNGNVAIVGTASTTPVPVGVQGSLGFYNRVKIHIAFLHNTTSGTFKLQFGNNSVSGGAGRISRIAKGSLMRWRQTD